MHIPKRLYKYESFTDLTLRNLKRQSIYFSSPKGFNDPYDCAITAEIQELDDKQLDVFRTYLLSKKENTDVMKMAIMIYTNSELEETLKKVAKDEIDSEREKIFSKIGVTCLSEKNDDLLMWSHYGGRYKGFCLEFNTEYEPFSNSIKVEYSDRMPQINPLPIILGEDEKQFLRLFSLKSESWSYEKEWRIIHENAETLYTYLPEALTGIYFGPDIEFECLEIVSLIIGGQNPNVKLYRGKRSSNFFKVDFEEFNYTPYIVAKNKE